MLETPSSPGASEQVDDEGDLEQQLVEELLEHFETGAA